jgi:UDP-N-acetylglucosamine 2-epimerase (non-hydrolysing)
VQEETSALGVRCFTLRNTTERPITVERGTNSVLGIDPERIRAIPAMLRENDKRAPRGIPLWDGSAGTRAADVLKLFLASMPTMQRRRTRNSKSEGPNVRAV